MTRRYWTLENLKPEVLQKHYGSEADVRSCGSVVAVVRILAGLHADAAGERHKVVEEGRRCQAVQQAGRHVQEDAGDGLD